MIRHQSTSKTAYFVAKESWPDQAEAASSPFNPFAITFNTDESMDDKLTTGEHIITRHYIPIRLTTADTAAISKHKAINWKTITIKKEFLFQALRVFGDTAEHLTLPTAALYSKRVYRDLDQSTNDPDSPLNKKGRQTPAQAFDSQRVDNSSAQSSSLPSTSTSSHSSHPSSTNYQLNKPDIPTTLRMHDCQLTNTIQGLQSHSATNQPPPTTIEQQINSSHNPEHTRKQRDFPTPDLLKDASFQHIAQQLNRRNPSSFPNIYLRLTVVVNHIYYVFTTNSRLLKDHACVTLIDRDRLMHFVPIKSPTERHRTLWKHFSKANTNTVGYGSWIPLFNLPDLALLSKTVPMREHFALVHYIQENY